MQKPQIKHPRFWTVVAVLTVVLVSAVVFVYIVAQPTSNIVSPPTPTVQTQVIVPTDFDQVRAWFGPWETLKSGATGSPALVMLRIGGSVDRSSWTVTVNSRWIAALPPQITAITAGSEKVKFALDTGHVYTVGYNQPFIIDNQPQMVYAFTQTDSGWKILSMTAKQVHQLGQKT